MIPKTIIDTIDGVLSRAIEDNSSGYLSITLKGGTITNITYSEEVYKDNNR